MPTLAEQAASLISESFTDGLPSDGAPTEQENAAAAANGAKQQTDNQAGVDGDADSRQESDDGHDDGRGDGGTGEEAGSAEGAGGDAASGDGQQAGDKGRAAAKAASAARIAELEARGKAITFRERVELADLRIAAGLPPKDRIAELTVVRRSAEREADAQRSRADRLEAEIAALKSGKAPLTAQAEPATSGDTAPDPSQFDYGELDPKYIAALARHETVQALKAQKAEDDKTRQSEAAAARQREIAQKQDALLKAGVKLHDDFDEVVMQGAREGKWELTQHLGELLLDSEFGPQIAYELAKDPDEAARVAKLSPTEQAKYLGRQEAKFEAAKSSQAGKAPPKAPQAPPPPKTPRGSSGSNKVGADSQDFAAVEAAWRGGQFK